MKKVLIIGPEFHNYNLSIERAFNNLGFESKVIGYFGNQVSSTKERIAYHLASGKESFLKRLRDQFNSRVLQLYYSFKPDLVFIIQASDVYADTIEKMVPCKKVLWMMDTIFGNAGAYGMRNIIDYIFLFENTDVPKLWDADKIRSWFLPLALDEKVYYPVAKTGIIDILFVGKLYENRIELLEKVCEKFKNYTIKIYGNYYSPLRKPLYHLLRKNKNIFLNKNIAPATVNQLYNQSKICLNIHHHQSQHGVNQRFFEISGSKAFQLVDSNPYIAENFSAYEIMVYDSAQELFEKIDMILKEEKKMNTMAEKAYKKVLANHTFTHRIKQMLDIIQFQKDSLIE